MPNTGQRNNGLYQIKPYASNNRVYKPKEYTTKPKDILAEHPPEVKPKLYRPPDPNIDPLTGLTYNHLGENTINSARPKQSKENPLKFPMEIGSPVRSISRTLKFIESTERQVRTTTELQRQINNLKHLIAIDEEKKVTIQTR